MSACHPAAPATVAAVAAAALFVAPAPAMAAAEPPTAPPVPVFAVQDTVRADLIDYGSGAFPLRAEESLQATAARAVLDGLGGFVSLPGIGSTGPEEPVQLLIELPAPTTFDAFAVPPMSSFGCCSNTHIRTVTVEGSATGPDEGFERLVQFEVEPEVYDRDQEFAATAAPTVRWLRVTLAGRQVVDPDDYRGTTFTDLRGYGTQASRQAEAGEFTGIYLTGGGGSGPSANRIELVQNGALVTGCRQSGGAVRELSGGIENGMLKVLAGDGVPSLFLIDSQGRLLGVEVGRSYGRTIGVPGGDSTDCSPTTGEALNGVGVALDACEAAVVYGVNFDVDSDQLRPDSEPALEQILEALQARPALAVAVEGHTDSDATEAYNLDLSQRRAETVVAWLAARGVDAARLTATGVGEARPVADNETAAGKAANRRVEIRPACG
ncbi:OmpA family protein [Gemmatimonadota bacterium DH-20]|uniref:OmpA family protein n=1 Tax=Gaopeijia maritima TaxID=3119007 RepID=A0ABU9EB35_9BACT